MNYDPTMQPSSLIAITAVMLCWLLQWPLQFRIRAALRDRHPEVYQTLAGKHLVLSWGLTLFIWNSGDKWVGDPAISRDILRIKLLALVAAVVAIGGGFLSNAPNA